jgi:hypothetical protein
MKVLRNKLKRADDSLIDSDLLGVGRLNSIRGVGVTILEGDVLQTLLCPPRHFCESTILHGMRLALKN